jgi:hypothetical protein
MLLVLRTRHNAHPNQDRNAKSVKPAHICLFRFFRGLIIQVRMLRPSKTTANSGSRISSAFVPFAGLETRVSWDERQFVAFSETAGFYRFASALAATTP